MEDYSFLQERDLQILKTMYFLRFMHTGQIEKLFFKWNTLTGEIINNPKVCANKRLKRMREAGLIKSYNRSGRSGDAVHTVAQGGIYLVAGMLGKVYNDLYYSNRNDYLSFGMTNHSLMIGDAYVTLREAAERRGGDIPLFQVEQLNHEEFKLAETYYKFRPDIFMIYRPDRKKENVKLYFIEIDNSTETPKRFSEKFDNYEAYFRSGIFQEKYSGLFPQVITTCNDEKRIKKLRSVTNTFLTWKYVLYDQLESIL